MAATEEKVEVVQVIKPEANKPEAANKEPPAATASVVQEENPEPPLKYKTWNLKVSVHCEGCKKKVKKILHSIDGVYEVDVDLRQQKATVKGNVDGETLVKKLIKKTGKHAELWPEKSDHKDNNKKKKKKSKNKDKDKQSEEQESSEEGGDNKSEKEKELPLKNEVFQVHDPSKNTAQLGFTGKTGNDCGGNVVKPVEVAGKAGGGGVQFKEVMRSEVKPVVILPPGSQSPVADQKIAGESEKTAANGSGSGSKKKKKKGHKGNTGNNNGDEGEHSGNAPAGTGSPPIHGQGYFSSPYSTSHSPPRQQMQHFPPYNFPHSPYPTVQSPPRHHSYVQQPIYYHAPAVAVSHSTVHPSASYGGSYHTPRNEYAYMHSGTEIESPPSNMDLYSSQPSDSFEFLSDENPNACSIM